MNHPKNRLSQENLLEQQGIVYCPECGAKMKELRQKDLLGGEGIAGYECPSCNTYLNRFKDDGGAFGMWAVCQEPQAGRSE